MVIDMMITYKQAQLAASEIIRTSHSHDVALATCRVPRHIITAAIEAAESAPDVRTDRIEEARLRLAAGEFDADDIAEMMLKRVIADNLR